MLGICHSYLGKCSRSSGTCSLYPFRVFCRPKVLQLDVEQSALKLLKTWDNFGPCLLENISWAPANIGQARQVEGQRSLKPLFIEKLTIEAPGKVAHALHFAIRAEVFNAPRVIRKRF